MKFILTAVSDYDSMQAIGLMKNIIRAKKGRRGGATVLMTVQNHIIELVCIELDR